MGEAEMKIRTQTKEKAVSLLAAHPVFSAADRAGLLNSLDSEDALFKEFAKGQTVYPCHSAKRAVVLLTSGECTVKQNEKITGTASQGSVFGLESLYGSTQADFKVCATTDCKALVLKKAVVDQILENDFSVTQQYLAFLTDRLSKLSDKAQTLSGSSAESKLAAYLLARPRNSQNEVELPQDLLKLSKQLSLGRDALYRAIDRLNSSGAIKWSGRAVSIADEEKLKEFIS